MFYGGEILDNMYQIIREIGKGGAGVIYLAWHMRLQKEVVVKKLKDEVVGRLNVRAEVDILKRMHHSGLPQVYDFLQIGSEIYTVIEYIPGNDLQYYIDQGYRFEEGQLILWLQQLCQVLDYLHNYNPKILHSDIKPANIMVTPEGNVYLIDFNISLDMQPGSTLQGISSHYAAPEQAYNAQILRNHQDVAMAVLDGRMDIYSLGATFYRLMTGFMPEMAYEQGYTIDRLEIPYSEGLKSIIAKAMEWDVNKRYASASAMNRALGNIYKSDFHYRNLRILHWATVLLCSVLLISGIWSVYYGWQIRLNDNYEKDFQIFLQACNQYDNDAILDSALDILNNRKYKDILLEKNQDKAQLFNQTAEVFFEQEMYSQAFLYYERAIEADNLNSAYYRNAAIAAARSGDLSSAQNMIQKAQEVNILDSDLILASQEIAYCEQNYEKVISYGASIDDYSDTDTIARSYLLTAKAYMELGNSEMQMNYLEKAYAAGAGIRCQRELGKVCLEQAQKTNNRSAVSRYLNQSEACFKKLWNSQYAEVSDGLNLAITLELKENYSESMQILRELDRQNVQLYQVYMHMAYVSLKMAEQFGINTNFQEAQNYYNKAVRLYKNDSGDDSMEIIKNILEQKFSAEGDEE